MLGVMGTAILVCVTIVAFQYNKLPFVKNTKDYSAYFSEAGGIKPGSTVRVSGLGVGRVSDVRLEGTKVRVGFTVRDSIDLGDRTEAAIKTETILGSKMLELTSRGDGRLTGTIPLERTTSPYDLPDIYQVLARQGLNGDYFGFYFCEVLLKLNGKGGNPIFVKLLGQPSGRCTPQ